MPIPVPSNTACVVSKDLAIHVGAQKVLIVSQHLMLKMMMRTMMMLVKKMMMMMKTMMVMMNMLKFGAKSS